MFHMKDERSTKLYLCTLSEVVYHFLFLLLLPHGCKGFPQVIGSSEPIVVNVGDDVMLPCLLKQSVNAATQTVEWTRPDLKPRFVHLWRSGVEILDDQNPSYVGRTSLFISELKNGNVSLKLSRVKLSDKGKYRCFMPNINRDTTVELLFGSVSSPGINISKSISGVSLDCQSKGWYPEPEVLWLDGKGKVLSAEPAETLKGPDGLFTVSSRVSVEKSNRESFTCRVYQEKINQTRETHVQISADLFGISVAVSVTITVFVMLGIFAAAGLIFWKWRQNQTKEVNPRQDDAENGDGSPLIQAEEKIKDLEVKNRKLEEELNECQGKNRQLEEDREDFQEKKKTLEEEMRDFQEKKSKFEEEQKDLGEKKRKFEQEQKDLGEKKRKFKLDLVEKKGTLEKESKRNGEEEEDLKKMIQYIRDRSKEVQEQMGTVRNQKEEMEKSLEEFESKFKSAEKTAEKDKAQGFLEMKNTALTAKKHLKSIKKEEVKLCDKIQKFQKTTQMFFDMTTKRKKKVEGNRREIRIQIGEIERKLCAYRWET